MTGLGAGVEFCSPDWFCSPVLFRATQFQVWFSGPYWEVANERLTNSYSSCQGHFLLLTTKNPNTSTINSSRGSTPPHGPSLSLCNFSPHFLMPESSFSPCSQVLFAVGKLHKSQSYGLTAFGSSVPSDEGSRHGCTTSLLGEGGWDI